ncbi:S41 family peptidase [Robertkochia sediminum]|uniref:S41 family peptidase n=1 Tax=Robertkochia sediminum TaxID=2785326 RepID=UPI001933B332|nr:S41 family peptidase [Robertkochia sediminum]MBL7471434.1 S41 family peptidase [Robertkochia sediminum]
MKIIITIIISFLSLFVQANDPIKERKQLLDQIFEILETNIANPAWLEEDAYVKFKNTLYSEKVLHLSEEKFIALFKQQRHTLPFSHFDLRFPQGAPGGEADSDQTNTAEKQEVLTWKAIDEHTAYLDVNTFVTDAAPMIKAVQEIGIDRYENLIIDLRGNGGGSLDAPVVLGQFLTDKPMDAGVYLTRKWFEREGRQATHEDIAKMPFLQDMTYQGIGKMFAEEAAFRMVLPGHNRPIFKGKVYVLIDGATGSACEPLVDLFKKEKIGTLVGEKTFGGMLSGKTFPLNEKIKVFLPIADFQTATGERIDKVGVSPDIRVLADDALDYVLENLIK